MKPTWWLMASGAGVLLLLAAPQAAAGLAVSPLRQEVFIEPGDAQKVRINLSNAARGQGGAPQSARLEVMDFSASERGALIFQKAGTRPDSASPWITLSKTEVKLAPGESETVECLIQVPRQAAGEYYSAIVTTLDSPTKTRGGIEISYRIASGIFVTVPGRLLAKKAEVVRCEVLWPSAEEGVPPPDRSVDVGPLGAADLRLPRLVAVLKNTGHARFDACGQARIRWPDGRVVFRAPLKTERSCVQPGDTRLFGCLVDKPLPPGEYLVEVDLSYQPTGGKARRTSPLPVSEAQAAVWAGAANCGQVPLATELAIQVTPEMLSVKAPPGALRVLSVSVKNATEGPAQCRASWKGEGAWPIPAAWVTLDDNASVLGRGRTKSVALTLRIPEDAAGIHKGVIEVRVEGETAVLIRQVPMEVMVSNR